MVQQAAGGVGRGSRGQAGAAEGMGSRGQAGAAEGMGSRGQAGAVRGLTLPPCKDLHIAALADAAAQQLQLRGFGRQDGRCGDAHDGGRRSWLLLLLLLGAGGQGRRLLAQLQVAPPGSPEARVAVCQRLHHLLGAGQGCGGREGRRGPGQQQRLQQQQR
jgi:hypothetical protein